MKARKSTKSRCAFAGILGLIPLAIFSFAAPAHAAFITYELEGQIITPIYDSTYGRETFTGYYYAQFINKGDLTLVLDNVTGRIAITGTTYGCVVASGTNCSTDPNLYFGPDQVGNANVNYGWGYFDWNLYMTGGRGPYGSDSDNPIVVFENMDPDIGYVQLKYAHPATKEFIGVGAKFSQDHGYALALVDGAVKNDGLVYLTAWLEHQYGVLGGHARAESDRNSSTANTWLVGYEVKSGTNPPPPPNTEIPEPSSLLLLSAAGLGCLSRRRKSNLV